MSPTNAFTDYDMKISSHWDGSRTERLCSESHKRFFLNGLFELPECEPQSQLSVLPGPTTLDYGIVWRLRRSNLSDMMMGVFTYPVLMARHMH